ncbi:cupin domain-containing protein [Georgenia sp. AZ-5]|uniref:cupin domain-containing protein n=1 Tax=Georgenia sp. AZ-5 TaxID=3367526 RepID=UPI0037540C0B
MRIYPQGNREYVYNGRFTGPVQLEMIIEAPDATQDDIARVHCTDGAVTFWHSHPGGQVLMLLSGTGRVGTGDGEHRGIEPGTVVETPPGEPHWHGADDGHDAVWLAITRGVTDWTDQPPVESSWAGHR